MTLATTQWFSSETLSWAQGLNLPAARHFHGLVSLSKTEVLIAGGFDSGSVPRTECWVYDHVEQTFLSIAALNIGRGAMGIGMDNDKKCILIQLGTSINLNYIIQVELR